MSKSNLPSSVVTETQLTAALALLAPNLAPTTVQITGSVTATAGQMVLVNASTASVTVNTPTSPTDGEMFGVKVLTQSGSFQANIVTTAATFGNVAGQTSRSITVVGAEIWRYDAALSSWLGVATDLPITTLDNRYVPFSLAVPEWTANSNYAAGQQAFGPPGSVYSNQIIVPIVPFESGATFNAANWQLLSAGSGGGTMTGGALGTVGATATIPSGDATVTATTTATTGTAFTLPASTPGLSFSLYISNPASGTVVVPSFAGAGSDTVVYTSALSWVMTVGAVNIISFECSTAGTWYAYPVTSALGSSAPLQESINLVSPAAAAQTVPSPLTTPFYTINHYVLSANLTLTLPSISAAGGESFTLWVDQPSGGGYTLALSGAVRWVGGTAAVAPTTSKRLWVSLLADQSIGSWVGTIVSAGF